MRDWREETSDIHPIADQSYESGSCSIMLINVKIITPRFHMLSSQTVLQIESAKTLSLSTHQPRHQLFCSIEAHSHTELSLDLGQRDSTHEPVSRLPP